MKVSKMAVESAELTKDLNLNIELIKDIFKNDETLITRYIESQNDYSIKCCVFYIDGMVDNRLLNQDILKPILEYRFTRNMTDFIDIIAKQIILSNNVEKTSDFEKITQAIVYGDSVFLADGSAEVLILSTKGWNARPLTEPENEKVFRGPREGFNESIMTNLSMLRRRLRTQELKMEYKTFGTKSKTKACLCYIDTLVNKKILAELERRLNKFSIDAVLDVNYIGEFIKDEPYSPIKTIGSTERPDAVAAKLLEGRIALFLDGTPVVLTMPYLFIENFQSSDDYYVNYYFSSINRLLRITAFFISISAPGIYVALTTFHQEILPTDLAVSISVARQGVPMPTVVEAVIMLLIFEILRETGLRTNQSVGQALSIVGALVIGQAAVDAKLISAPMIIIISISGITGIMLPKIKGAIIILRYILLALCSIIGLYGYIFGMMGLLLYLINIRSFGLPIMGGVGDGDFQGDKDIFVRAPWWFMINRPKFMSADKVRSNSDGDPE
jgi:spore germination protein KA